MRPTQPRSSRYGRRVQPGVPSVVSIALVAPPGRTASRLRHEVHVGSPAVTSVASLTPRASAPVTIGPPFREGLWLAHNGPGDHRAAHWGSRLVSGRRITVPQRYAIDFMGLDPDGRVVRQGPEGSTNEDWPGFGRDVLAVADGVVAESRDGVVDTPPLYEPPPPRSPDLADAGGNYVVLDIGQGRFVHFAHLKQGSVRVRRGQRVRRGDPIGNVGNSGNTNGAHLHFNVVDHPRQTLAEGLPYVFESIVSHGSTTVDEVFRESPQVPSERRSVDRVLPLNGALVEFVSPA
jgi:murein DD-endopeptidase MepM/ murein hydrolase activator NlpD